MSATVDSEESSERSGRPRILVVDDSEVVRRVVAEHLRRAGFCVRTACSGSEALAVSSAERFDAFITDYSMEGVSGVQLIRLLRHDDRTATTPVLLLSGAEGDRHRTAALRAGADAVVSKEQMEESLVPSLWRCMQRLR